VAATGGQPGGEAELLPTQIAIENLTPLCDGEINTGVRRIQLNKSQIKTLYDYENKKFCNGSYFFGGSINFT